MTGGTSSFGVYISSTGGRSGENYSFDKTWGSSNAAGGDFSFNGHCFGVGQIGTSPYTNAFYTSSGGVSYRGLQD